MSSDGIEGVEVPLYLVCFDFVHLSPDSVEIIDDLGDTLKDALLAAFAILDIPKSLLLEEATDKEVFNFFKLRVETVNFLVVILFNSVYLLTHVAELDNLVFNLILELGSQVT